jgi:hypothetical protein
MSKLEQKMTKIIQSWDRSLLSHKKFNIEDSILIAGTPRSGTTWLMEIIGAIPGYTFLFEPLNPIRSPPGLFKTGFHSRTYLPADVAWVEGERYLEKVFTGCLPGPPPLPKPRTIIRRIFADKLIIKSINMTRLLPWISKRFSLRDILFIIRHPCAVVASQLQTGLCAYVPASPEGKNSFPTINTLVNEASRIINLEKNVLNRLKKIKTIEEILAAVWCLDNYVPLSSPKPHPWKTIVYERLVKNSEKEIILLYNKLGEKMIPSSVMRRLNVPSASTILGERIRRTKNRDARLSKWTNYLSETQKKNILDIVALFALDFYSQKVEPEYKKVK